MSMAATRMAFTEKVAHIKRQLEQLYANTSVKPKEVEIALLEISKKAAELAEAVDGE